MVTTVTKANLNRTHTHNQPTHIQPYTHPHTRNYGDICTTMITVINSQSMQCYTLYPEYPWIWKLYFSKPGENDQNLQRVREKVEASKSSEMKSAFLWSTVNYCCAQNHRNTTLHFKVPHYQQGELLSFPQDKPTDLRVYFENDRTSYY